MTLFTHQIKKTYLRQNRLLLHLATKLFLTPFYSLTIGGLVTGLLNNFDLLSFFDRHFGKPAYLADPGIRLKLADRLS